TFLGCGDELEHRDGEDGGRHIVSDAFEFECGGDTGAYRHDLEDRRDDCGSGRNEQRADEKRKVPVGPEEKAYRERRADERDESTYRDESKRGRARVVELLDFEMERRLEHDDGDRETDDGR